MKEKLNNEKLEQVPGEATYDENFDEATELLKQADDRAGNAQVETIRYGIV